MALVVARRRSPSAALIGNSTLENMTRPKPIARTSTGIRARLREQSDLRRRLPAVVQGVSVFRNWNLGKIMSAKSDSPNYEQGSARAPVDDNPIVVAGNFVADCCDDALMAGAASIADIDRLMDELQRARDFLQSEGERLRKMTASYANLAQTASASAKIIAQSLGKWRDNQGNGGRAAMPGAHSPSLTPDQDADAQRKDH
jgi:hypothetical protein